MNTAALECPPQTLTRTEQMFMQISSPEKQVGGAGGSTTYDGLLRADQAWERLRNAPSGEAAGPAPRFVSSRKGSSRLRGGVAEFDVAVCGGTLGIFLACALQLRGLRVAVVERGPLQGRAQEWNISRKELEELVSQGVLTEAEVEECINIEFNPNRCAFYGYERSEVLTTGILNLGVSPIKLVARARARFEEAGGQVVELTGVDGVVVYDDCVELRTTTAATGPATITAQLLLDCMGHASPIVRQARWGQKPDGMCLVVGTVGRGFDPRRNQSSDVICTASDVQPAGARVSDTQYFWEAFPAGSGPTDRTTYMFTYMDASPARPSLEDMFEDYWELMPRYQGIDLDDITVRRALFGFFPTFRDSPLPPQHDRILQIGDASGIQSPLSFGGFGALLRHMPRLSGSIQDAVRARALDRAALAKINAYNPALAASWLFQRAMSVQCGQRVQRDFVNRLMGGNFQILHGLGDPVMKPFLQDVVQFQGLTRMLAAQMAHDPVFLPQIIAHLGPGPLVEWVGHMWALAVYTALHQSLGGPLRAVASKLPPRQRFELNQTLDSWKYGAGMDFRP